MAVHDVRPLGRPGGRTRRRARRAAVSLVLALAGLLMGLTPASAAVDITPTQAAQGGTVTVTFHVPNLRPPAYTTTVQVDLPPDQPVDEVYPLTHPDWIPRIVWTPAPAVLGKVQAGRLPEVTSAIVWTRAPDAPSAPPVETLEFELGPLPYASSFVFSVTQTYSDGTVEVWKGPAPASGAQPGAGTVLTLAAPAEAPEIPASDPSSAPPPISASSPTSSPAAKQGPGATLAVLAATGAVLVVVVIAVAAGVRGG